MSDQSHDTREGRSVENTIEIAATPEQIWDAIATVGGTSAWFAPTEAEPREGGPVSLDMGEGFQEAGVVTAWEPPRRFAYEEEGGRLATEFLVEARAGGTCVVRLVTTLFASDDFGAELESMRDGWDIHLRNLELYLTRFPGERCWSIEATGAATGSLADAWSAYAEALGLPADAEAGERVSATAPGTPPLSGVIELVGRAPTGRGYLVRLDEPAPGAAIVFAYTFRGGTFTNLRLYLFGREAEEVAARDEPAWRAWMSSHFPRDA